MLNSKGVAAAFFRDFILCQATVQLNAIRAKTRTATAKDVEASGHFPPFLISRVQQFSC